MTSTDRVALDLTREVIATVKADGDERYRQVMTALIQHLHDFARQVDLTPQEWIAAIEFLTETGKICDAKRQEFILLSDTLGLSMVVVALAQARASGATAGTTHPPTEATVQGPYYWPGAPDKPIGADLAVGVPGEPTWYSGRVTDLTGRPIAGAVLDIWSGDGEGVYDMQLEDNDGMRARGRIRTDPDGRYAFWSIRPSYYPIPMDGPVGRMIDRMGRDCNRPGHIHMMVSAENHVPVTTHLFVANSPYLATDVVFGVRQSLVVPFEQRPAGKAEDGRVLTTPYWVARYDFRLAPAA